MEVSARIATPEDVATLVRLYRLLEEEMVALKPIWALADGLDEPIERSFAGILGDGSSVVVVGCVERQPVGFLWARPEPLLVQGGGELIGVVRLVFTEEQARGVGVGHEMIEFAMGLLAGRGIRRFDAVVSPGHRNAKNFFEAHGFKARSIVMHHESEDA